MEEQLLTSADSKRKCIVGGNAGAIWAMNTELCSCTAMEWLAENAPASDIITIPRFSYLSVQCSIPGFSLLVAASWCLQIRVMHSLLLQWWSMVRAGVLFVSYCCAQETIKGPCCQLGHDSTYMNVNFDSWRTTFSYIILLCGQDVSGEGLLVRSSFTRLEIRFKEYGERTRWVQYLECESSFYRSHHGLPETTGWQWQSTSETFIALKTSLADHIVFCHG